MAYYSTKTYNHSIGLSAVFRQPHADHSHCKYLHGYSLAIKFTLGCKELYNENWAVDFGGLKPLKQWLEDTFDHKTVIDVNDPHLNDFRILEAKHLCQVVVLDGVGAEKFAEHAWRFADELIREMTDDRCWCESAECSEHGANSAIYTPFTWQKTTFADA